MLKPENRLKTYKDFKDTKKKGKSVHSPFLSLRYLVNKDLDIKFAFIVSKRVSKKAVIRNRIKRQLREIVRLLIKDDKINIGVSGVFFTRQNIINKDYQQIQDAVKQLLVKSKIITKNKNDK